MSFTPDKMYYDIESHWFPELYTNPNEEERIKITLDILPVDVQTVLDVGCGNGVLTNKIGNHWKVIGLDRSLNAIRWVKTNKVIGNANNLPFRENSFDIVVATEIIEHFLYIHYVKALSELVRVSSKYILITVPYCEEINLHQITCPECFCSFHANYHNRSFCKNNLEVIFSRWGYKQIKIEKISPIRTSFSLLKRLFVFHSKYILHRNHIQIQSICPQCGYKIKGGEKLSKKKFFGSPNSEAKKTSSMLSAVKKIINNKKSYRWWIALYKIRNL